MTTIIIIASIVLALIGMIVAVWSIINTRRNYYNEYIKRKRND